MLKPNTGPRWRSERTKEIALKAFAIVLAALLITLPSTETHAVAATTGPVSIAVKTPQFGFNVLPGSVRRIFATVTNGATNQVNWTVSSGAGTISSTTGSWVDVTAPATGTSCAYAFDGTNWSVTSATTFTVTATSVDDSTQSASTKFNVCNPAVQLSVVPFYRTLYANQSADVQSLILGSVNDNVHWAITAQPSGGDGKLSDVASRDTVFRASVAGRYTLTATSTADPTKTSSAIMYVTGHPMPYRVTPNGTEPVDCSVDPAMKGPVYEVGPSQTYKTLASVPFPTMTPGSTVRLHNEDTTGVNPTTFFEYVQISQAATLAQPVRMCGVPDAAGNLPIMDGSNATGRSDTSIYAAGYALVTLHNPGWWTYYPNFSSASYIAVEGIHFRNAKTGYSYVNPNGTPGGAWTDGSACIRINQGHNTAFVGNDYDNCGDGVFTAWNGSSGWGSSDLNVLWEGSHFHNNGAVGSYLSHQAYLQAWGEIVQFNRFDSYKQGAFGSNLKSRGIQSIIRYNYMGDGAARQMDLIEVQDAPMFMSFDSYLSGGANSYHSLYLSKENYPADVIAAEQEAWNSHFVYGNIYQNSSSNVPIHFSMDHDGGDSDRKGNLYWYNNTFYEALCANCQGQTWTLFDTTGGGGNFYPQVEYGTVQIFNNVIFMEDGTRPFFQWNNYAPFIGVAGKNLIGVNWGSNDETGGPGTGWNSYSATTGYQNAANLASHLTGFNNTNLIPITAKPFDSTTWILNSNSAGSAEIPTAMCEMPVRFAFLPSLGYAVPRIGAANVGATDTVAETASMMTSIAGSAGYNTHYANCR